MIALALAIIWIGTSAATMPMPVAEVQAHRSRMIATQLLEQKIENALAIKSRRQAREGAKALTPMLVEEEKYWDRANVADALQFAQRNASTARRLEAEAGRGDLKAVSVSLDALRANCVACHGRHPETRMNVGR